jgi:uncharacterized membrane protein YfcA
MRDTPTSQIRAPLFSRVALASSLPAGAAGLAYLAATEAQGLLRYTLVAFALLAAVIGVRWAWRVASRETERLR